MRSIVLRAIPFFATIWIVAAASCAVAPPTPTPAGGPPQIPHSLEGREGQCLLCHEEGVAGAPRVTAEHLGRTNDICTLCHIQAAVPARSSGVTPTPTPAAGPPQIPHSLEGREGRCLLCHEEGVAGAPRVPLNHAGRTSATCTACHQPAAAGTQTPAPTASPVPSPTPALAPPSEQQLVDVSHGGDIYAQQCAACHGSAAEGGFAPSLLGLDPKDIEGAVRQGKGDMPAFGTNTIKDQDLRDIVAYIRSLASSGSSQ